MNSLESNRRSSRWLARVDAVAGHSYVSSPSAAMIAALGALMSPKTVSGRADTI
ncbi:hypothetical protein OAA19_02475 [Rubripirellula sp.]|nr:hypothetical protein [Rubripirellula sp.]MDB4338955.1 hypothetical protein [Rubripirellula sp.]